MFLILELFFQYWYIMLLFFIVAVVYASVGFGGGSSYLAILAFTGIVFTQIRTTALLCNIVVVLSNVFLSYKNRQLNFKKIIPLVLCSVPLAYFGGKLAIDQKFFFILLGCTLFFAAIFMWISKQIVSQKKNEVSILKNVAYGGVIGFVSGMVGIGGGIFLAPLLHLTNWGSPKKIAAITSFFILLNSIAGLFGQYSNPNFQIDWKFTSILLGIVFVGGLIGNRIQMHYFTPIQLKKTTAILIALVGLRILWMYLK